MRNLFQNLNQANELRKLLGWETLDAAIRTKLQLEIIQTPPTGPVLVLAPHPDDDVFGAGGAIAKHRDQGDEVRVVYLCDGRSGTKRAVTEIVRDQLKLTRHDEAIKSAELLGVPDSSLTFWSYRDGGLSANKTTTKLLTQIIADYVPRTIYAPNPNEPLVDYAETAAIVAQTLKAIGGDIQSEIWSYEVWQPTFANRLLDISEVIDQKAAAIRAHESQLKARPYLEAIEGLNIYRGAMNGLPGPAEAFLALKPKLYLKLWELLRDFNG